MNLKQRYITSESDEWGEIKTQVKEGYFCDLFDQRGLRPQNICLIENREKTIAGFTIVNYNLGSMKGLRYYAYSLVTHTMRANCRSAAVATKWVKTQFKETVQK